MRVVSENDAIALLPSLIRGAKEESVVIKDGDEELAVIVSMDDYKGIRRVQAGELLEALHELGDQMRAAAAEEGMSVDELERMLDRKAPQISG